MRLRSSGRYTVEMRVIALAQQVLDQVDIRDVTPRIDQLTRDAEHTVHLASLIDDRRTRASPTAEGCVS